MESLGEVVKVLNPLGHISEMYANTLNYKVETRRLKNEIVQMKLQAKLLHKKIDLEYSIKMEQIAQNRAAFEKILAFEEDYFNQSRMERKEVLRLATAAFETSLRDDISIEKSRHYAELSAAMINQLHVFGDRNSVALLELIRSIPEPKSNLLLKASN